MVPTKTFAQGKVHVVEMKKDIFVPDFLEVALGDTVRFVNVNGSHNSESIPGMIPSGVTAWRSRLRQDFELQVDQPGVYGYKCTPHYSKGMVGLIVARDPAVNLQAAQSVSNPRRAQAVFDRLFTIARSVTPAATGN